MKIKITDRFEIAKNIYARNRLMLPAMDTLMAEDGFVNEFHIQHYGSKSYGGLGTIIVESTAISPEGKIRHKDLGLWKDEQIEGFKSLSKIIKMGGAVAGIQLNHAGAKAEMTDIDKIGSTKYFDYLPQERLSIITLEQIKEVEDKFVSSALRAKKKAGFDFVEINGAHGYLLSQFMHFKLNDVIKSNNILVRGKSVVNIVKRIHEEVKIPIGIRLSVTDHEENGMNPEDFKPLIKPIEPFIDYINVSSGEAISHENVSLTIKNAGTHLYRIPLAKKIRNFTKKPLIIAGNVSSRKDVEEILNSNIDGLLIGRESIFDPNFTQHILSV